jgi:PAS domain-containing protein
VVLRKWATNSRINCEHRCVLVEAELAHIEHRDQDALKLYETALNLAEERGFHHHSAVILECMAKFFARIGYLDRARETIARSIDGYVRWGACAVVAVLVAEHSELLRVKTLIPLDPIPHNVPANATGTNVDMTAVLECSSVVCESSNLGKLLTNFLSHIVTYFHATHGCVILTSADGKCLVHALWGRQQTTEAPCAILLTPPVPVPETYKDLSSVVCCSRAVRCALTMKRTVIVNDLQASGMYADLYFTKALNGSARSLVCMPLLLHGSVRAFAYLESNSVHTFTIGNLQTLQLMCAQAAIALENSRLVENEIAARAEAEAATAEKEELLQEMQASKQRYQMLAQSIPQLIWTSRADGYVEWTNDQYSAYVGGEVLGDVWSQYMHPEDIARIRTVWLAFVSGTQGNIFSEEMRIRGADGKYEWFLSRALPAHDSKGNVVRWFGTSTVLSPFSPSCSSSLSLSLHMDLMLFIHALLLEYRGTKEDFGGKSKTFKSRTFRKALPYARRGTSPISVDELT